MIAKVKAKKIGSVLSRLAARLARNVGRCRHGVRGYTWESVSAESIITQGVTHVVEEEVDYIIDYGTCNYLIKIVWEICITTRRRLR
jgi:hypothetical protein